MDWTTGLQNAIDYIEEHILEEIDYEAVAARSFSSSYHFQRVFSILCGYTVGEYIRCRRLSLAANALLTTDIKVIDAAYRYGYESPDSFTKAFQKFHGVLPSQARSCRTELKSFSRLVLKLSMEGGKTMHYRLEERPELILTGFKTHFTGAPYGAEREKQEEELFVTTRGIQWFLIGARDDEEQYCVITKVTDEGYDFWYCVQLDPWSREHLYDHSVTGVEFIESLNLEHIVIPKTSYAVFTTEDPHNAIREYRDLLNQRIRILTEWMPEMGFRLKDAPELAVYHWMPRQERRLEIWMPIERIEG